MSVVLAGISKDGFETMSFAPEIKVCATLAMK